MNINIGRHFVFDERGISFRDGEFVFAVLDADSPSIVPLIPKSRSFPYLEVTANKKDGSLCRLRVWEDLAAVRVLEGAPDPLLVLDGRHWTVRCVRLNAFTDRRDTVVEENEFSFFRKGIAS